MDVERRLFDKLHAAFNQACAQRDAEIARAVHVAMALTARRKGPDGVDRRGGQESRIVDQSYDQLRRLEPDRRVASS